MEKGHGNMEYTRAFSLLNVNAGLVSNCREIIYDDEYFLSEGRYLHSLLSNFNSLKEIPFTDKLDFYLFLIEGDDVPFTFENSDCNAYITGNLCEYEKYTNDKRLSIFGNMGIFSKLYIKALEDRGIFSLHSASFYDPKNNHLYIVIGGSGSGKSTVALAAITREFKLFGAELTHFSLKKGRLVFYKGPLTMNCRVGNIVKDFPQLIKRFNIGNIPSGNIWQSYKPVYFGSVQTEENEIAEPELTVIYPRIEEERTTNVTEEIGMGKMRKAVFDSMAEKISPPTFLYKKYFVPSVDEGWREVRRMEAAGEFCGKDNRRKAFRVLASPNYCLDKIV